MEIVNAFNQVDNTIIKYFVKLALIEHLDLEYIKSVLRNDFYKLVIFQKHGFIKKNTNRFIIPDVIKKILIRKNEDLL